eukprot:ANDGO_00998.mRNA.1 hypothetical protein
MGNKTSAPPKDRTPEKSPSSRTKSKKKQRDSKSRLVDKNSFSMFVEMEEQPEVKSPDGSVERVTIEDFPSQCEFQQSSWKNESSATVQLCVKIEGVLKSIDAYIGKDGSFTCSIPVGPKVCIVYSALNERAEEEFTLGCGSRQISSSDCGAVIRDGSSSLFAVERVINSIAVRTDSEPCSKSKSKAKTRAEKTKSAKKRCNMHVDSYTGEGVLAES